MTANDNEIDGPFKAIEDGGCPTLEQHELVLELLAQIETSYPDIWMNPAWVAVHERACADYIELRQQYVAEGWI